jgi:hypothetical protein
MNDLTSVIRADWNNGIWQNKGRFAVSFVVSGVVCGNFLVRLYSDFAYKGISVHASLLECLMYIFRGMKEYNPDKNNIFELPIVFVVLNLYLAYLIGDYAVRDLEGYGLHMLLKTGSRVKWWISKCIWNVATVFLFYVSVFIGVACVFAAFERADGSLLNVNDNVLDFILGKSREALEFRDIMLFFAVLMITSAAISLCQMAVSLYLKPLAGFILVAVLYVVSGYYMSGLLPGNYMMLYRSSSVDVICGLWIDVVMIAVAVFGGYGLFRKRDLVTNIF